MLAGEGGTLPRLTEGLPPTLQVLKLRLRRFSTEQHVSMGEPTESLDDRKMATRKIEELLSTGLPFRRRLLGNFFEEPHPTTLHGYIFRVLEWHEEERLFNYGKIWKKAGIEPPSTEIQCLRIMLKRGRCAPVEVPWKLIQKDNER